MVRAPRERVAVAFIETIPPSRAEGELKAAYGYMAQVGGHPMVARIVQLFSPRPASLRRMVRSWELTMWMGDEPRPMRETVAAAISRLNDCHY